MRFLRNPEVFRVFLPDLLIAALATFLLYHFGKNGAPAWQIALIAAAAFTAMGIVFLVVCARYAKQMERFTHRIEKNLQGHPDLQFEDCREGDFAKLQSVAGKMVLAHFEQEKLLQTEKQRLKEALEHISHQIKTPLTAIGLNSVLLADPDMDPARRRAVAHRTSALVERIRTLLFTLLQQARVDAGVATFKKETFSAQKLVNEAVKSLELTMELHNQTLIRDFQPDLMIEADLFWLTEALMNVIKNCTEHTPDEGTITVQIRNDAVSTFITVRDTGPGIAPEVMPHLFERYITANNPCRKSDSFGIGLPYAKLLLQNMGGRIWAENDPNGGAVFTMRLDGMIV